MSYINAYTYLQIHLYITNTTAPNIFILPPWWGSPLIFEITLCPARLRAMSTTAFTTSAAFPVFAYTSFFIVWLWLSCGVFLTCRWDSVISLRRSGHSQVVWTMICVMYIVYYGVIQTQNGKYKEGITATIALINAVRVLRRILWRLWILEEFRKWAEVTVVRIRKTGLRYAGNEEVRRVTEGLLVNDGVVIGDCDAYVDVWKEVITGKLQIRSIGVRSMEWMRDTLLTLIELVKCYVGLRYDKEYLQPDDFEYVWIRWGVVFASQGMQNWKREFIPAEPFKQIHPPLLRCTRTKAEMIAKWKMEEQRQNIKQKQLSKQSAAVLLTSYMTRTIHKTTGEQLWGVYCEKDGNLYRHDLVEMVQNNREIFPFGGGGKAGEVGAKKALRRVTSDLPDRVWGEDCEKFDVETIEWLAITLGFCAREGREVKREVGKEDFVTDLLLRLKLGINVRDVKRKRNWKGGGSAMRKWRMGWREFARRLPHPVD